MRPGRSVPFALPAGLALLSLAPALLSPAAAARAQEGPKPPELRTFFTLRSAQPNQEVAAGARAELARLENPAIRAGGAEPVGRPLSAVLIDLDGDGRLEKFVPGRPTKPGAGTPWVIVDGAGAVRGTINGGLVFVGRSEAGSWPSLETYGKTTSNTAVVSEYAWSNGRYAKAKSQVLGLSGIEEYFGSRPALGTELRDFGAASGGPARSMATRRRGGRAAAP